MIGGSRRSNRRRKPRVDDCSGKCPRISKGCPLKEEEDGSVGNYFNSFPLSSVETTTAADGQRTLTVDSGDEQCEVFLYSDELREGFAAIDMTGTYPCVYTNLEFLCKPSCVFPVPVTTSYVAYRLSDINRAAPDLVQSKPYGLCVFVAYNTDENRGSGDEDFTTTAIAYYPRMLAQLAEGKNPKFCDTALLSILKKKGVDYRPTGLMSDYDAGGSR